MTDQIETTVTVSRVDQVHTILTRLLAESGLDVTVTRVEPDNVDVSLEIHGPDSGLLVGHHGQVLEALQYLLTLASSKYGRGERIRIALDADRYRARRVETLIKFANALADQVLAAGEEAVTDPLNPAERRIIHTALVDRGDVCTYSEGVEPNRYVVVSPKGE